MTPPRPPRRTPASGSAPEARFSALFGSLPRAIPPAGLRARILSAYDAQEADPRAAGRRSARPAGLLLRLRPALLGAAAAAAAVLVVGLAGPGGETARKPRSPSGTQWVTVAEAPASSAAPFRFIDDPSLPLQLAAAGPLDGP